MHAHVAGAKEDEYPEGVQYERNEDDGGHADGDQNQYARDVSLGLLMEFDKFHHKMAQRGMLEPE